MLLMALNHRLESLCYGRSGSRSTVYVASNDNQYGRAQIWRWTSATGWTDAVEAGWELTGTVKQMAIGPMIGTSQQLYILGLQSAT